MYGITIPGPNGPISAYISGEYYIVQYGWGSITAGGSPTFVQASPPIGPVDTVNLGDLYQTLLALLNG